MASWTQALAKTRGRISGSLTNMFGRGGDPDETAIEDLEATLLQADVPVRLAAECVEALETKSKESRTARLHALLMNSLGPESDFDWQVDGIPLTILIVGVNGSGKTTTAAKLAHQAAKAGRRPLLGAADTFRAAGSHQLRLWAERIGCDVVAGATGADPASVAYDALDASVSRQSDVLIVDTAGRMHTREPLMKELQKVRRAMEKRLPDAPHQTWIVLDATIGQNALIQAREFHSMVPLTGVIVAKLDGSAKAGFLFGVASELNVPIMFAGLGEQADDLVPFDRTAYVDALLGIDGASVSEQGRGSEMTA